MISYAGGGEAHRVKAPLFVSSAPMICSSLCSMREAFDAPRSKDQASESSADMMIIGVMVVVNKQMSILQRPKCEAVRGAVAQSLLTGCFAPQAVSEVSKFACLTEQSGYQEGLVPVYKHQTRCSKRLSGAT